MTEGFLTRAAGAFSFLMFLRRVCGWRVTAWAAWLMLWHAPEIVRTRSLHPIDPPMSAHPPRVLVSGTWTYWNRVDTGLWRDILLHRCYEPAPEFAPRAGDVLVDLGANVGAFAITSAVRIGRGRVFAIEATREEYDGLLENIALNHVEAVVQPLFGLVGSGGLLEGSSTPAIDLDELLTDVAEIALLKVDIEGSEFTLFAEAGAWLDRVRRIAMEVHTTYGDVPDLIARCQRRGFRVVTQATSTPDGIYLYASRI